MSALASINGSPATTAEKVAEKEKSKDRDCDCDIEIEDLFTERLRRAPQFVRADASNAPRRDTPRFLPAVSRVSKPPAKPLFIMNSDGTLKLSPDGQKKAKLKSGAL